MGEAIGLIPRVDGVAAIISFSGEAGCQISTSYGSERITAGPGVGARRPNSLGPVAAMVTPTRARGFCGNSSGRRLDVLAWLI